MLVRALLLCLAALVLAPRAAAAQECGERLPTLRAELERDFFEHERRWNGLPRSHQLRECEGAVADALASFRTDHGTQLADNARSQHAAYNRFRLYVVEARYAARDGQTDRAVILFERARGEPAAHHDTYPTSLVDVQLAFLRGDRSALEAARERLRIDVAAPPFNEGGLSTLLGQVLLGEAEGFARCFGRSYLEATTNRCNSMARAAR